MREAPELQNAYQAYIDRGVFFLGVFAMSEVKDIRKHVETYQITFPVGEENGIAEKVGAVGIPTTVFIDRDGKIVQRHYNFISFTGLVSGIEAILEIKPSGD